MNKTFRLAKKVKYQGMAFTACFLAAVVGYSTIFFLEDPAKHGFKGEHSVAVVGWMGIAVFGTMALLSIYIWAAYYVERFGISGSMLSIRSMLQNREFDVAELKSLEWKANPIAGSIRFQLIDSKARLDLHDYDKEARLQIIRALSELVPYEKQERWPMFCHKVALPLRDGKPSDVRVDASVGYLTITRSRYDRMFLVGFPAAVVLAAAIWSLFGLWQLAVLPLLVVAAWLFLRTSIPAEGRADTRLTATPAGRAQLIGWGAVVGSQVLMIALSLIGFEKSVRCTIACVVMLAACVPVLYLAYKSDRQMRLNDERGVDSASWVWQQGEIDRQS